MIELARLREVVWSDDGWRRLGELFAADLDQPAEPDTPTAGQPPRGFAGEIRSWLPDHTHHHRTGGFFADVIDVHTWTTAAGVWSLTLTVAFLGDRRTLRLDGPSGHWTYPWVNDETLQSARLVLLALGAITGPAVTDA